MNIYTSETEYLKTEVQRLSALVRAQQITIDKLEQALAAPVQEPVSLANEVIGCFNAAMVEGLQEALAETTDERLKDLVERRLMYALYAAQEATPPAQPAPVQEPVAWMHVMDNTEGLKANGKGIVSITQKRKHPFGKPGVDFSKSYPVTSTPLYTTPPAAKRQWVGLTDEEFDLIYKKYKTEFFALKEVEAKLKEKNT
jgi:hypothetical protein